MQIHRSNSFIQRNTITRKERRKRMSPQCIPPYLSKGSWHYNLYTYYSRHFYTSYLTWFLIFVAYTQRVREEENHTSDYYRRHILLTISYSIASSISSNLYYTLILSFFTLLSFSFSSSFLTFFYPHTCSTLSYLYFIY